MRLTRSLAITAALGISIALAGCGSDSGDDSADPTDTTTPSAEAPEETAAEEVTTGEEAPTYDVEAVDLGEPGETEPGSTIAIGEAAWVTTDVTPSDAEDPVEVPLGLSLLQITEGDPSIWADWDNADEFEGYTPYLMVLQYVYPEGLPDGVEEPPAPAIFPLLEDGKGASFIEAQNYGMGAGASDECGYVLQGWDPETNTLVMCAVGLSDAGEITGGLFNGDSWSGYVQGLDPTYGDAPIIWE